MKKDFKKPELEVVHLFEQEIITTSPSMHICTTDCLDGSHGPECVEEIIFGG